MEGDDEKKEGEAGTGEPTDAQALMDSQKNAADDGLKKAMTDELGFDPSEPEEKKEGEEETDEEKATREKKEKEGEEEPDEEKAAREKKEKDEKAPAEGGAGDEGKIEGLSPEVQEQVDKRVGKITAKWKDAEESLVEVRADLKEREARIEEMETEAREKRGGEASSRLGMNKLFEAESPADLDEREDYLWEVEKFCLKNNRDGHVGTGTEDDPEYTVEQIQERLLEVREERERILPRAREVLKRRQELDAVAQKVYPELGDKRSEASVELRRMLRLVPGLRMRPEVSLMVGDMLAGRKKRKEKEGKTGRDTAVGADKGKGKKPGAKQPTETKPAGPGRVHEKGKEGKSSFDKFAESGFDEETLVEAWD